MTPKINERIEKIRRGEVPDGYKKTKVGIVPSEWKIVKLGDCIIEYSEKTTVNNQYPVLTSSRKGIMLQNDYFSNHQVTTENNVGYNVIPRGYITFRSRSDDGNFRFNENNIIDKGMISYFYPVFYFSRESSRRFMLELLNFEIYKKMYPLVEGTAQQVLSINKLKKLVFCIPPLAEQEKIAEILSTQDKLIELKQRKIDELKKLKKIYLSKMFPKKGSTYPEIRFPGFTDPWEQRKLSETFDFLSNNTLSRADLNTETGSYTNVHYGDVLIKFGEYIDAQSVDLPFITDDEKAEKFLKSKLQNGDIIFADTAEDETVGKCVEIGNIGDLSIISGLHTIPCRPKQKYAPAYLGFYLNSGAYHDQLMPLMQGIKVTSISKSAISETVVSAPKEKKEQEQIGLFFTSLDHLITLHQRELEETKKYKKALMQLLLTGIVRVKI